MGRDKNTYVQPFKVQPPREKNFGQIIIKQTKSKSNIRDFLVIFSCFFFVIFVIFCAFSWKEKEEIPAQVERKKMCPPPQQKFQQLRRSLWKGGVGLVVKRAEKERTPFGSLD